MGRNFKELTCATCDILNLFPKREKSSIASFVFRASGSSKEELVIVTSQNPRKPGLREISVV